MTKYSLATLLLLLLHLPGVFLFRGEFTDGVLQTVYFNDPIYVVSQGLSPAKYVPPLYPAFISWVSETGFDPLQAGRLVSLLAYCGTALILACLGKWLTQLSFKTLSAAGIGWTIWSFWALSPVANRWAFHAMTDMTFCFFSTLSVYWFLRSCSSGTVNPFRFWFFGNLAGLFAVWTRYQGYALGGAAVLAIAIILFRASREVSEEDQTGLKKYLNHRNVLIWLLVIAAWSQTYAMQQQGREIHSGQFTERAVYHSEIYLNFAITGLRYFPYAVTLPLFVLFLIGTWKCLKKGRLWSLWTGVGLAGGVAGLAVQTWFLSFQFRYGLPFLPWVCLVGGIGLWTLPKRVLYPVGFLTLLWLGGFSGAVLYNQNGTFADMKSAADQIHDHLEEGNRVWAREEYNFLPDGSVRYGNVKISVWSGVPVMWLDEGSIQELKEGDLIVDPSVTPIPQEFWRQIRIRWRTDAVIEETAQSLPLTPGEILWVQYPTPQGTRLIRGTSDPNLMRFRYKEQFYSTTVYRLGVCDKKVGGG